MNSVDAYAECFCGSGKKVKWCCLKAAPQVDKVYSLIQGGQHERALAAADQLPAHGAKPEFAQTMRTELLMRLDRFDEAQELIDQTMEQFPDYALACDVSSSLLIQQRRYDEAVEELQEAARLFPAEAVRHRARVHTALGRLHLMLQRPLAAWSSWMIAAKLEPGGQATTLLAEHIEKHPLLPLAVRKGLRLKPPDELAVFDEGRRAKWDEVMSRESSASLEQLLDDFRFLVEDDQHDKSAWCNLLLAHAWKGDDERALECLDKYLALEDDPESVSAAADLGEVLRLSQRAPVDRTDYLSHFAFVEADVEPAFSALLAAGSVVAMHRGDDEQSFIAFVVDRPVAADGADEIDRTRRRLAEIRPVAGALLLTSYAAEAVDEALAVIAGVVGEAAKPPARHTAVASLQDVDGECRALVCHPSITEEQHVAALAENIRDYWEGRWIARPLKSLDGLSPLTASSAARHRPRLEGVLRFRERAFEALSQIKYDFARLRNKLGLEKMPRKALLGEANPDVSTYSVAELAKLNPREMGDADLIAAYRAANSLEAPRTAMQFAEVLVERPKLADRVDLSKVYRRLIVERLEEKRRDGTDAYIDRAIAFDRTQGGANEADFLGLRAWLHLGDGKADQAVAAYRQIADKHPDHVAVLAQGVEKLLSAGHYKHAGELAGMGLDRARKSGKRDLAGQFEEYREAALARG